MLPLYNIKADDINIAKQRVIELLKNGWCKYNLSIDRDGRSGNNSSYLKVDMNANKVCLIGACHRANINDYIFYIFTNNLKDIILSKVFHRNLAEFNDSRVTVKEVLEVVEQVN